MALPEAPETQSGNEENGAGAGTKAQKMKKPVPPDSVEKDKQVEKLTAEIERYADRIQQIKDVLASRKEHSRGASGEEQAIIRRIKDIRTQFQAALKQKQAFREEQNRAAASRDALRSQLRELKDRVKYTTVEEIDVQISRLEEKLNHSSMSSSEEEWSVEQVRNLARSRATVRTYQEKLNDMQGDERPREELASKLRAIDARLDELKAEEMAEKERLQEIRASREDETSNEEALQQEKKDCYEIILRLREKRSEIRTEYNAKYDEFKKLDSEYRQQQNAERKKRQEQKRLENEQRQAERAAREAEYKVDLYDEKAIRCDQLLSYLGKFAATTKQDKTEVAVEDVEAPGPGFKLLNKDGDDLDGFFAGTGKKGKGKKQKGKKLVKEDKTDVKKLIHTIDILQEFHRLQVTVPNTVSEVPKAIQELKERKEHYNEQKMKGGPSVKHAPNAEKSKEQTEEEVAKDDDEIDTSEDVVDVDKPAEEDETPKETNTEEQDLDKEFEGNQEDDNGEKLNSGMKDTTATVEEGANKDMLSEETQRVADDKENESN